MKEIGRNDPCPCGSGKKYKRCCLQREVTQAASERSEKASAALQIPKAIQIAIEHHQAGRLPQAQAVYQQVLKMEPNHPDALNLLGVIAHQLGKNDTAVKLINKAIRANPFDPAYYSNIGSVYGALKRVDEAIACYRKALSIKPDYAEAHNNLGVMLKGQGKLDEAIACYQKALLLKPSYAEAHNNLGNVFADQGKRDEAVACYRKGLSFKPDIAGIHHTLIYVMNLIAEYDGAAVFAQCRMFAEQFEKGTVHLTHRNNSGPDRRIKVGYVSGDFRQHSVAYFIEPVLANHDDRVVEVFCYSNHGQIDYVTKRLMSHPNHWRSIVNLSDDKVTELIQQDGIDILVDLSGHTAHNRLLVFARKPAPVQVTWLGLPNTTGLPAMDYRLTDRYMDPVGMTEQYHTETLIRLPFPACFKPEAKLPPVNELPALANGRVTFSSFNNFQKITPAVFALWSRILALLPDSRLMMICPASFRDHVNKEFADHGVGAERLIFVDRLPLSDYLALHHHVDIALDPFPYNGGTITRNSLWMGVPVVTLAGRMPVSRVGLALMSEVGLPAFIAQNEEEYAQIALRWARDLEGLAQVRRALRQRVQEAPFSNAKACTRELEAAYRQMWRTWCSASVPSRLSLEPPNETIETPPAAS